MEPCPECEASGTIQRNGLLSYCTLCQGIGKVTQEDLAWDSKIKNLTPAQHAQLQALAADFLLKFPDIHR